jgi:catechol 2,3-dioxygenase-like lactoylglutathione lyase family enzyme
VVDNLYARSVFFVKDADSSLRDYTDRLGFSLDWNHQEEGRPFVFQVSLMGFQLIVNQTEQGTRERAGHGRVFIGLDEDQLGEVRRHIRERGIETSTVRWGAPALVIRDLDENEIFISLPERERSALAADLSGPGNPQR